MMSHWRPTNKPPGGFSLVERLIESIRETGLVLLRAQLHLDYGAMLCVAAKAESDA